MRDLTGRRIMTWANGDTFAAFHIENAHCDREPAVDGDTKCKDTGYIVLPKEALDELAEKQKEREHQPLAITPNEVVCVCGAYFRTDPSEWMTVRDQRSAMYHFAEHVRVELKK